MKDSLGGTSHDVIGIILLNLGGPDSLKAVKPFLYNLFSDRQIIRLGPSFLQKPLAWLISTIRSKKTEQMYGLIGGKSPMLEITNAQAKALEEALNITSKIIPQHSPPPIAKGGVKEGSVSKNTTFELPGLASASRMGQLNSKISFKVYVGMRYWHPFIEDIVPQIYNDGIRKLIALSLYPQYSVTTTGSSLSRLQQVIADFQMEIFPVNSFYNHPYYIDALVDVIQKGIDLFKNPSLPRERFGKGTPNSQNPIQESLSDIHVLFSAHSLPQKIIDNGDPYEYQTKETIREIMKRIPLNWHLGYQSRSGPVKWLEPSTDEKIKELALEGIKNILIVPISFVSDHIETLYEIDILYKNIADTLGINLRRVDSLNTHQKFIEALKDIVITNLLKTGWI